MQGNRKSSVLLCWVKIFIPHHRMCIDQCPACCHFSPRSSFQVSKVSFSFHSPFQNHCHSFLHCFSIQLILVGRQESVGIKTTPGAAKVIGTVVCVGGAMLLSFYHGQTINLGESGIHWKYAEMMRGGSSSSQGGSAIWGSLYLIISSVAWAAWFVIQVSVFFNFASLTTLLLSFLLSQI